MASSPNDKSAPSPEPVQKKIFCVVDGVVYWHHAVVDPESVRAAIHGIGGVVALVDPPNYHLTKKAALAEAAYDLLEEARDMIMKAKALEFTAKHADTMIHVVPGGLPDAADFKGAQGGEDDGDEDEQ